MADYTDPLDALVADPVAFARQAAGTVELEQRLRQTEAKLNEQRIVAALDGDPVTRDRWRKVDSDRAFLDWLNVVHEFSGERRMNLLRRAELAGNTTAIVNLFKSFILEGMPNRVDNTPLPYQNARRTPAPSGSTRRWKRSEIRAFYDAARKGRYSEAARARIESDILAAARENRVVDPPLKMIGDM
jgi:sulfur carrier protein ThiS